MGEKNSLWMRRPANIQRDTPEQTYTTFLDCISNRTFDYDFEHLPTTPPDNDLV